MLTLVECVFAIAATTLTCMFAGRIAAMTLTVVTTATAALVMPPYLSWQVESETDIIALFLQTAVGLAVAYGWPRKTKHDQLSADSLQYEMKRRPAAHAYSLRSLLNTAMGRNTDLGQRIGHVEIDGECDDRIAISEKQLENVLEDVLRMAVSDPKVQRVSIQTGRQPAVYQIALVAEYKSEPSLPALRLLGRTDRQRVCRDANWPDNCSATYFDNGYEHIYLISIHRR